MRPAALALTTVLLVACSGKAKGPDPDDDKADGKVLEVTGEVTAQRRGSDEVRKLAASAEVFGDDTVVTGADSSVKIELAHNQAVLSLGASMTRALYQTAAWRASSGKGSLFDEASGSQTAAAGRHAERQSADTPATADKAETTEGTAETAADREWDNVDKTKKAKGEETPDWLAEGKRDRFSAGGKGREPGDQTKMPKFQPPDESVAKSATSVRLLRVEVAEGKPTEAALSALKARLERAYASRLRVCHERRLAAKPDVAGTLSLLLEIGKDGHVAAATAKGLDEELAACIQESAAQWTFDALVNAAGTPVRATVRIEVELALE